MKINLKLLRVDKGKTLHEVSADIGLSVNTISKLERNEIVAKYENITKLYNYYGYELTPRKLEENE